MPELKDRIVQNSGTPCERLTAGRIYDRCGAVYDYTREETAFRWERHADVTGQAPGSEGRLAEVLAQLRKALE